MRAAAAVESDVRARLSGVRSVSAAGRGEVRKAVQAADSAEKVKELLLTPIMEKYLLKMNWKKRTPRAALEPMSSECHA